MTMSKNDVLASDRRYLRKSHRRYRLRRYMRGEFDEVPPAPEEGWQAAVLVRKVGRGMRLRTYLTLPAPVMERRSKISQDDLRILDEQGFLPIECLLG